MASHIVFRQLNDNLPMHWLPKMHWYVEYHDEDGPDCPRGLASVLVPPDDSPIGPMLLYVFVLDEYRRQGIARRLIEACERRWPNMVLTDSCSEAGEALLQSLEAEAIDEPNPSD